MRTSLWIRAVAVAVAAFALAPVGGASGKPKPKPKLHNFKTIVGKQEFTTTGHVLRQEVDCPKGYFAINGGYLTSGIVVSTWKNFALRHPEGWVAEVYAPPAPPPFPPQDDVSLSVKVDCAKSGVPLVLPVAAASRKPKPKPKPFVTVLGPVKEGKSGDKIREEVHCPSGYTALNGGYVAGGILVSTWENFPVRHPDGWVAEIYAPPNGPYGPAQDISLKVKVDCARSGVPLVLPAGKAGHASKAKKKNFVTVYAAPESGHSGDRLHAEAKCPKGFIAFNGGAQVAGGIVSTWRSFAARSPDAWEAEVFAPPAGPYAPPEDVSLKVKVDCARGGIPVVLPAG